MSEENTNHQPSLPSASSASLILTHPRPDEQKVTWSYSHPEWGHGLTQQGYLDREVYLLTIPLARDGGMTQWILTDSAVPEAERPVLASCETLKKRALVRGKDGIVRDVWAHGVASVFTYKGFRGKGYAGRMMAMLGEHLAAVQSETGEAVFSILFSDIGKSFYAKSGWMPMESTHLEFLVRPPTVDNLIIAEADPTIITITDDDLSTISALDEKLLRKRISTPNTTNPSKTRVAIIPNLDTFQWHYCREDFMCNHTFSRKPTIRGALFTSPSSPSSRVWALWTRVHYGGLEKLEENRLHFLRLVVEDEDSISDVDLERAIKSILAVAQKEAVEWQIAKLDMWNPSDRVRKLVEETKELDGQYVVREKDSITSLKWFGDGSVEDVDWVANEKYEWC